MRAFKTNGTKDLLGFLLLLLTNADFELLLLGFLEGLVIVARNSIF